MINVSYGEGSSTTTEIEFSLTGALAYKFSWTPNWELASIGFNGIISKEGNYRIHTEELDFNLPPGNNTWESCYGEKPCWHTKVDGSINIPPTTRRLSGKGEHLSKTSNVSGWHYYSYRNYRDSMIRAEAMISSTDIAIGDTVTVTYITTFKCAPDSDLGPWYETYRVDEVQRTIKLSRVRKNSYGKYDYTLDVLSGYSKSDNYLTGESSLEYFLPSSIRGECGADCYSTQNISGIPLDSGHSIITDLVNNCRSARVPNNVDLKTPYELCMEAVMSCNKSPVNNLENIKDYISPKKAFISLAPKALLKQGKKSFGSAVQAAAQSHLINKYQVQTTIHDLDQNMKQFKRLAKSGIAAPKRFAGRSASTASYSNTYGNYKADGTVTRRAKVLARPRSGQPAQNCYRALDQLGLCPSASNLWDCVPLSFVVDWFVNIGEILDFAESAVASASMYDILVSTCSSKHETNVHFENECYGASGSLRFVDYRRDIYPESFPRFSISTDFTGNPFDHIVEGGCLLIG